MNRLDIGTYLPQSRIPRTCGDEPDLGIVGTAYNTYSPHVRG